MKGVNGMNISDKLSGRTERIVEFSKKHRCAKVFCLGALCAVYSAEYIRSMLAALREKSENSFVPFMKRCSAAVCAVSFAFMVMGGTAGAAEYREVSPDSEKGGVLFTETEEPDVITVTEEISDMDVYNAATTPDEIADMVSFEGLSDIDSDYSLTLNVKSLRREVTARFSSAKRYAESVKEAFESYGIDTGCLYIYPVDVTVYCTEGRYRLNLTKGYTADITFPIPDIMDAHLGDLKAVRLEDDGTLTVLEGTIGMGGNGRTFTFNTDHLSLFALVSYNTDVQAEYIGSGAGVTASGVTADIAVSENVPFDEDRRKPKKRVKRKVYRIKRIINENDLLL